MANSKSIQVPSHHTAQHLYGFLPSDELLDTFVVVMEDVFNQVSLEIEWENSVRQHPGVAIDMGYEEFTLSIRGLGEAHG